MKISFIRSHGAKIGAAKMTNERILITGSTGLLGSYFVPKICRLNFVPYLLSHHQVPSGFPHTIVMDLLETDNIAHLLEKVRPHVIVNFAACTDVDKCELEHEVATKLNKDLVSLLSAYANENNSYLLHISTDYVFDGSKGRYKENDKANPINWYGLTKLQGEQEITSNKSDNWCIARTSTPFGIHSRKKTFPVIVIEKLLVKEPITVLTDQYTSPILADYLAEMLIEIVCKRIKGVIHVAGSSRLSRYEQACKIARLLKSDDSPIIRTTSDKMTWRATRPLDSSLDVTYAERLLDNKPKSFDEGIRELIKVLNLSQYD